MALVQVAQRAEDLARATAWYSAVLGGGPVATYDPPGLVFFDLGGVRLLLEHGAPSALVYLGVDDVDAALTRAIAAGGAEHTAPHVIFSHADATLGPAGTDEWQAFVRDTEGNLVGLVEQRVAAVAREASG
ncbi:VOC family protein [Agrococcus sp. SGAir0287]|uniref:VOC family protein n=1 Tax=Agrococcus sp. SGAir0287 TaxID=2070347 RepID=UPI0010CD684A|nr:VOC family protein [Agrococcus sp. SGAir0287]QCR20524.1 methylmalonyl-CoA epimerase [Agrococcus sp. SGAir0287]